MAHRLQMKLGVVPEADRLPDSPDTVLHVEPRVGSQTRTKGHLYLLVTSRVPGHKAREATRLVADSIRAEYYYDESAGIRVCLAKAIVAANRRLSHARERAALGSAASDDSGPVGVAVAVVRDNELYVCTVGPAEAYLSRGARLSTLPDPHRDRGLPATELEPDVWRGEVSLGDQLLLVSPAVSERLGPEELKDALVTLHPQAAVERLHARYTAAAGTGSDGAITLEVGEVATARSGRAPVAVRPAEPLAGVPDRSPIPLADSVVGGVAAAQSAATSARAAAGGLLGRLLRRVQDALPARAPGERRVTPMTARRETQQRAAVAILSILVVVGVLGAGVYVLGGHRFPGQAIQSLEAGQQALQTAQQDLDRVLGPGVDLVANDPRKAATLLNDAIVNLTAAAGAGIPAATIDPLRARAVAAIDRLYHMLDVGDSIRFAFPTGQNTDLQGLVRGPDGAPFVLDAGTKAVYRIDVHGGKATVVFRAGTKAAGSTEGTPELLAVGARDLLILDSKSVVWRWRAADTQGHGTLAIVRVNGSSEWGGNVKAIGTFLRNADAGLYNLYVVDPPQQQVLAYAPAITGQGFPSIPTGRLASPRDVSGVTAMYIDGDIWLADGGQLLRIVNGGTEGWTAEDPGDGVIRSAPSFTLVTSGAARREGRVYGYDPANRRVIAYLKSDGSFVEQYRLGGGDTGWADLRSWYVEPGVGDQPDTLVWISAAAIHATILEPPTTAPTASPGPTAAPTRAPSPRPSTRP
ncbi:MAG TPA: hypothetical protein VJ506_08205 [Candidatus Limnocylindrales bacterium]|nr:hypothetical protein [Candidatus Limnocylindrales bacterium]